MKGTVRRGPEGLDAMVGGGESKERGPRWVQKRGVEGKGRKKNEGERARSRLVCSGDGGGGDKTVYWGAISDKTNQK
jgi:hypothetical protein